MSDMEMDESIIKEFLIESYENLDQLDRDLVALEKEPTDRETLASVFRTIHTIKEICGFLGFSKLESVAHTGENLLSLLRDGQLLLNPDITTALLSMVDGVREILGCIENEQAEGDTDYSALIETLERLQKAGTDPAAAEKKTEGSTTAEVEPDPAGGHEEDSEPKKIGDILVEGGQVTPDQVAAASNRQQGGDPRHLGEILVEEGALKPHEVVDALKAQGEHKKQVADSSIRVDVELLDKLMNLVGELVLARNQILQFSATQQDTSFAGTSQRLNLITTELQEGVMKTRMQPIGDVWSKFPRVVRDLALACGKKIRIEMEGKETDLDKTISEAIKDPLTHIVRNSADHGIESPEVRIAAGKPAEGRLLLRAFHEGGQVNIEITDDGGGIDPEKIKAKAVEKSLITEEQAQRMGDREAVNLIFLPGFSMAEKVSNVSGRGVGMDVVKTNIEKIGGTVDIISRAGEGTTLKIKIPLTLAIIPALIVTCGGDPYAIPQVSLLELVRLESDQARNGIESIHGAPVYRLRGNLLPLVYLNRQLKIEQEEDEDDAINIVVLQADDRQFGLVVEGINDTEEIVVKPLGKQLKSISVFAGTTIMGDGKVALILDILGIAQQGQVVSEVRDRAIADKLAGAQDRSDDVQTLLLLGVNGARLAVPLSLVARLEEFNRDDIEQTGDLEVVQYRNQIVPLIRLSKLLNFGEQSTDEGAALQVVVYTENGHSVGLAFSALERNSYLGLRPRNAQGLVSDDGDDSTMPYGLYEPVPNRGTIVIGLSADTPESPATTTSPSPSATILPALRSGIRSNTDCLVSSPSTGPAIRFDPWTPCGTIFKARPRNPVLP